MLLIGVDRLSGLRAGAELSERPVKAWPRVVRGRRRERVRGDRLSQRHGAGVHLAGDSSWVSRLFGFLALILASVNIFGGFLVTQRMLAMYKKKG